MKLKFLAFSLMLLGTTTHNFAENSITKYLKRVKQNKVVQESAVAAQALFYATITGLLSVAAVNNMESVIAKSDSPTRNQYFKNMACKSFLPVAAGVLYFSLQSLAEEYQLPLRANDKAESSDNSSITPCTC